MSRLQCDVAVVGAGAAGLSAAITAAEAGASVMVVDGYRRPGGQYFRQRAGDSGQDTHTQRTGRNLIDRASQAGVSLITDTTVWGAEPGRLDLLTPEGVGDLTYKALVVATGAIEVVAPFPGWTLPGVLTAGAVQTLLKEHDMTPGDSVVLAGTGPLQLVVASALLEDGVRVEALVEASRPGSIAIRRPATAIQAMWGQTDRMLEGAKAVARLARHRVPYRRGWGIVEAIGTDQVEGARLARLDRRWRPIAGTTREVACNTIAVHHGLAPFNDLLGLMAADFVHRPDLGGWIPVRDGNMATTLPGVFAAGDCAGIGGAGLSVVEGEIAGRSAAAHASTRTPTPDRHRSRRLRSEQRFQNLYGTLFGIRPGLWTVASDQTIVCRCEDVSQAALRTALDHGAISLAAVKSLTRCGMGPCQGRVCGPAVAALVESTLGTVQPPWKPRPPLTPVPLPHFGGVDA